MDAAKTENFEYFFISHDRWPEQTIQVVWYCLIISILTSNNKYLELSCSISCSQLVLNGRWFYKVENLIIHNPFL